MIESVCRQIKNYFITEVHSGSFTVSGGTITDADFLTDGYYLIWGSKYNDGVHLYPDDTLIDEKFSGDVALMNPPEEFLNVCEEITEYCSSEDASPSPYKKESFGGYSYERDEGGSPFVAEGFLLTAESVEEDINESYRPLFNRIYQACPENRNRFIRKCQRQLCRWRQLYRCACS